MAILYAAPFDYENNKPWKEINPPGDEPEREIPPLKPLGTKIYPGSLQVALDKIDNLSLKVDRLEQILNDLLIALDTKKELEKLLEKKVKNKKKRIKKF
jgi:hypothetical protein